jgi:glutamyl-tRNA(Gln) amidotransferase subunit E
MSEGLDPREIRLRVGIELHRQLKTPQKLFCACPSVREDGGVEFRRMLRPSESELGEVDPAAMFEASRGGWIKYRAGLSSSCLVEADEEPPHPVNMDALKTALIVCSMLNSEIVDEVHVMRKIVIDGSNTAGFQRTMVVGLGGEVKWPGGSSGSVPIQTITLEEDAARILPEGHGSRDYSLDRLGIPLIEISLSPVTASPQEIQNLALFLGRLLKSTGRVERGLGSVRQDLNVSVMGGEVVEVKGVQQLDMVVRVLEFEVRRQLWFHNLSVELRKLGLTKEGLDLNPVDLSELFHVGTGGVISKALKDGGVVFGLVAPRMRGIFSREPAPGIRLGRELADIARALGLGGLLHSDELPNEWLTQEDVSSIRKMLEAKEEDGFLLVAGEKKTVEMCMSAIKNRLRQTLEGVPAETRSATPDGQTRFSRPRPGSARMYPETDIEPVTVTDEMVSEARSLVPKPWEEQVGDVMKKFGLGREQAERIVDSDYYELFLEVSSEGVLQPSFVASTLTETLVGLRREGAENAVIDEVELRKLFEMIAGGRIAKEAAARVLEAVLRGEAKGVTEAVRLLKISPLTLDELREVIRETLKEHAELVRTRKMSAFSALMGDVMSRVRGRVDGAVVSEELRRAIEEEKT